jgi:two-component system response regulator
MSFPAPYAHPPVLVVDDDDAYTDSVRTALAAGQLLNPVLGCRDASSALSYLRGAGEYADRSTHPLPAVIVTTFRLDGGEGAGILRGVRENLALRHTPVVVIGTTLDDDEVSEAHRLGATAYLARPLANRVLLDVIRGLGMPWSFSGLQAIS